MTSFHVFFTFPANANRSDNHEFRIRSIWENIMSRLRKRVPVRPATRHRPWSIITIRKKNLRNVLDGRELSEEVRLLLLDDFLDLKFFFLLGLKTIVLLDRQTRIEILDINVSKRMPIELEIRTGVSSTLDRPEYEKRRDDGPYFEL